MRGSIKYREIENAEFRLKNARAVVKHLEKILYSEGTVFQGLKIEFKIYKGPVPSGLAAFTVESEMEELIMDSTEVIEMLRARLDKSYNYLTEAERHFERVKKLAIHRLEKVA